MNDKNLVQIPITAENVENSYIHLEDTKRDMWKKADLVTERKRQLDAKKFDLTLAITAGTLKLNGKNAEQRKAEMDHRLRDHNTALQAAEDKLKETKRDVELALIRIEADRLIVRLMEIEIGRLPNDGH